MYNIIFYEDSRGDRPTADFIKDLKKKSLTDKNARVNFSKIVAYIDLLCEKGTHIGEPFIKHLDGNIWELRPLDNRILFANYKGKFYILLHHFIKKTNKTPPQEIRQAQRNLDDYIKRNGE